MSPSTSVRSRRVFLAMLIAAAAVSPLGINLYLPSLPAMTVDLGVDFVAVQLTLGLYLAAVAVGQLIVGPLSDRFGRRPIMLGGLACFVLGSWLCVVADSLATLYVGRMVQALGGAAGMALSRAVVRDLYGREQAASMLGYVTMAVSLAPMVAPTIGGVLEVTWGWRSSFVFLGAFGLVALLMAAWQLHETNPRAGAVALSQLRADYAVVLRSREFWSFALTNAFTASVFYAFVAGASYVMIEVLGQGPVAYGLWFSIVSLGYIVGNYGSGRLATKVPIERLVWTGIVIAIVSVALMALAFAAGILQPWVLFVPAMIACVGHGLVLPSCIAGAVSVRPEAAGAAAGLTGTLQIGAGAIVAPILGGLLHDSPWPLVWVMGVCAVLAAVAYGTRRQVR